MGKLKLNKKEVIEKIFECRIEREILDGVCLDCADFLNHPCVECEDCPVERLKKRFVKYRITGKENFKNGKT